jgi:hypothetical protein
MKKNLLWLALVLFVSGIVIASYKPIKDSLKEIPVERTISFELYKGSNYASKVYKCSSAEIYITVEKVRNATRTKVWDTTLNAKLLSEYPFAKKAFTQKVTIQNVIENKEHLEMNYVLKYNSNGSVLQIQSRSFILDGLDTLAIRL